MVDLESEGGELALVPRMSEDDLPPAVPARPTPAAESLVPGASERPGGEYFYSVPMVPNVKKHCFNLNWHKRNLNPNRNQF